MSTKTNPWTREPGVHSFELAAGESTTNPASTKRRIYGPARVDYRVHADGGIDAEVTDLPRPGARTIDVLLPRTFYEDHVDRGLPAGEALKTHAHRVLVRMDLEAYEELKSDADFYAIGAGFERNDYIKKLVRSAAKTLEILNGFTAEDFR